MAKVWDFGGLCCSISTCISREYEACGNTSVAGGSRNLHVIPQCGLYGWEYVEIDGIKYIQQIDLNNKVINPESGCDKHMFYGAYVKTGDLDVSRETSWEDGVTTRTQTNILEWDRVTPALTETLEEWGGKEFAYIYQQSGTGMWVLAGQEGGVTLNKVTESEGKESTDKKLTQATLSGNANARHRYIYRTTPEDTEETDLAEQTTDYIHSLVFNCASSTADGC